MPMTKITSLEHARALKSIGVPLTTEVEHRELPKRCDKLIRDVLTAASACRNAARRYVKKQSVGNYEALKKGHKKLGREIAKITPPNWIEEPNGCRLTNPEDAVVCGIVGPRCFTAFLKWADIIAELEDGNPVQLTLPDDVWPQDAKSDHD
jgi:hypothetical protein